MPSTYFFATGADLAARVAALQRERPLKYALCPAGGFESPHVPAFTSFSHIGELEPVLVPIPTSNIGDETILRDTTTVILCDAEAPVALDVVPRYPDEVEQREVRYHIVSTPSILFRPGGLHAPSRTIWQGEVHAEYGKPEEMRLYRTVVDMLLQGFRKIWTDLYGSEALASGEAGMRYTRGEDERWTYAGLIQGVEKSLAKIQKPENGRLTLEESWNWLEEQGYEVKRLPDGSPDPYRRRPTHSCSMDHGFSLFRNVIDHTDLAHLTLPYSYIGKPRGYQTSFHQSDFSHSRLAAGLFTDCDFSEADFTGAILANSFTECSFEGAILKKADFRSAWFGDCVFTGADMRGAKLLKCHAAMLTLSEKQRGEIKWHEDTDDGPDIAEW